MRSIKARILAAVLVLGGALAVSMAARMLPETAPEATAAVAASARGPALTGLPLPRYVSLKNSRVNVRRGPSQSHPVAWQYQRAGLPVEITREFENWRLIRDWEGEEGWVFHSLLAGTRTAMIAPWDHDASLRELRRKPDEGAGIAARLEPEVVVSVTRCDGTWCSVAVDGYSGWIRQAELWGVYPDERFGG